MPLMTRPIGYNPTQLPTGAPGEFDNDESDIQRRRQLMAAMMDKPIGDSGTGLAGGIVNFLQGVGNQYERGQLSQQEKALAQRRSDAADAAIASMPRDTPAVPPQVGTGPVAPPLGTPGVEPPVNPSTPMNTPEPGPNAPASDFMVPQPPEFMPNRAGSPMVPAGVTDWAAWAMKNSGINPMMAKVAEKGLDLAMAAPEKARLASEAAAARLAQAKDAQEFRAAEAEKTRADREYQASLNRNQQEYLRALAANDKEAMIRLSASLRPEKAQSEPGNMTDIGVSESGNGVVANSKTGIRYEVVGGVPSTTPYTGAITPKTDQAKAVAAATTGVQGIEDMQKSLKAVQENPDLYSLRTAVGSALPSFGGLSASVSGLSPEDMATRANIQSMTANTTHSLYGSAFSAGEQRQAKGFLIDPQDRADVVEAKLKGRLALEQAHLANLPASARAAQAARAAGTGGAPAGGKTVVKRAVVNGVTHVLYSDGTEGTE